MWLQLPFLLDVLTIVLFSGGCLLLYLGGRVDSETRVSLVHGGREKNVQPAAQPAIQQIDAAEPPIQPDMTLLNTPVLDLNAATDGENPPEQNKYARSVSAALAKSRQLSAS